MASGGSFIPYDLRILLVGPRGAGKTYVANNIIGPETSDENTGLCIKKKGTWKGQPVTVVDTPGWDSLSVQQKHFQSDQILEGAALCLPGPNVVILVLPISEKEDVPSDEEIQTACQHIELLSEKAWNYAMVLFVCKYEVEESVIGPHVKAAQKLVEECDNRHFILENDSQVADLQQLIEDLVRKTRGNCLSFMRDILPSYSGPKSHGTAELNRQPEELQQTVKQRRDSSDLIRPNIGETGKSEVAVQDQGDILTLLGQYVPPSGIILMAYNGALLGAVAGATDGVAGSVKGLVVGLSGGIAIALMLIGATRFCKR